MSKQVNSEFTVSSASTLLHLITPYLDYASLTEEAARNGDTIASYRYAKALCDRKVLEFQDDHPEIDITIRKCPKP